MLRERKVSMTCMENFRKLRNGGCAEWIPFTLDVGAAPGFTESLMERFRLETGSEHPDDFFDYDFRTASLKTRFAGDDPAALHDEVEAGTVFDEWGIGHAAGAMEGTCERTFPPLAGATNVSAVEALPIPFIETGQVDGRVIDLHGQGYPVCGYAGSIYEWSWWLRGMQQFMMDLVADPGIAEAIIRKVSLYTENLALETAKAGIDLLCFYDDAGMQTGM